MKVSVRKGEYVVAVSGGVDSMALLDILAKQATGYGLQGTEKKQKNSNLQPLTSNLELIVAHFNHGIRPDADADAEFVRQAAKKYKLPFEVGYGRLGAAASEERAREARYKFLRNIQNKYQAKTIVTAHHQDDLIETAIINLMRGTGRRGLTAISENPNIVRPLLHLSKKAILTYARKNKLEWREDPTNKDEKYLRNFVRLRIIPKLSEAQRRQLLRKIQSLSAVNRTINQEIENLSQKFIKGRAINRTAFISLPTEVACEVMMHFLRLHHIRAFDKKTIDRLVMAIKTARAGTKHDVIKGTSVKLTASEALLTTD